MVRWRGEGQKVGKREKGTGGSCETEVWLCHCYKFPQQQYDRLLKSTCFVYRQIEAACQTEYGLFVHCPFLNFLRADYH